jgi:hypothetical protein
MKNILVMLAALTIFPLVSLEKLLNSLPSAAQYNQKISMLEAYLSGSFSSITQNGVSVAAYDDPEVVYRFEMSEVNEHIFNIAQEFSDEAKSQIFFHKAHEAILLSTRNPRLLTDENRYTLQKTLMYEFLQNIDLEKFGPRLFKDCGKASASPRSKLTIQISWNRSVYKQAWATKDPDKINHACALQLHEEPFVPLVQKIKKDLEKK